MKRILKIILTAIFIIGVIFEVYKLVLNYSDDSLFLVILAFVFFSFHLFAWSAPKVFFNICWKISGFIPDSFDYDSSYRKLELVDIGIIITANVFLLISIILAII